MMWGGCSPTLSTMQGGNQEPKILEAKQLGFMDNGTGKHQSNTVYLRAVVRNRLRCVKANRAEIRGEYARYK